MVVVHVGQHDVPDGIAVDADQGQCLDRAAQKPSLARRGDLGGKSGVDDDGMMRRDCNPHEIVLRHRVVMRVTADKMVRTPGIALGVADRVSSYSGRWVSMSGLGSDVGIANARRRCEPTLTAYTDLRKFLDTSVFYLRPTVR
jgi:hypothetical protein